MESTGYPAHRIAQTLWLPALVAGVMIAALLVAVSPAQAQSTSPQDWSCTGVDFASALPSDTNHDGTPVTMSSDGRGQWVPVVFVHGWTGRSTHSPTGKDKGAFSERIDKTSSRVGEVNVTRSLIGQLQTVPGVAPFTFDYHEHSGRWVSDPSIGPALGDAIDCLFDRSGSEKVIVVAHSMGGLATRYALGEDRDRADKVSTVVTFGTPNTGSIAAQLVGTAADAASVGSKTGAVIRLILAACGQATTESMNSHPCDGLPDFVAAFDGEAGRALRTSSRELQALAQFPRNVAVHALYGDARIRYTRGWFGISLESGDTAPGDIIVTTDSALAGSTSSDRVRCDYEFSLAQNAIDHGIAQLQFKPLNDTPAPFASSLGGACFHNNLMRSIELSNAATIAIETDIVSRLQQLGPTLTTALSAITSTGTLEEGFTVSGEAGKVDCATSASPVSITDNIYTCTPSAAGTDVCWPEPGGRTLLCADNPWRVKSRVVV